MIICTTSCLSLTYTTNLFVVVVIPFVNKNTLLITFLLKNNYGKPTRIHATFGYRILNAVSLMIYNIGDKLININVFVILIIAVIFIVIFSSQKWWSSAMV